MELTEYICKMISQECCAISRLALDNPNDENHRIIMATFNRLCLFVKDYEKNAKDNVAA